MSKNLKAEARFWGAETLVERLLRCSDMLTSYGMMVPSEEGEVRHRIQKMALLIEVHEQDGPNE